MAISLFPHNQEAYESVVKMLAEVGKAAVIHPTGTGKYIVFLRIMSICRTLLRRKFITGFT